MTRFALTITAALFPAILTAQGRPDSNAISGVMEITVWCHTYSRGSSEEYQRDQQRQRQTFCFASRGAAVDTFFLNKAHNATAGIVRVTLHVPAGVKNPRVQIYSGRDPSHPGRRLMLSRPALPATWPSATVQFEPVPPGQYVVLGEADNADSHGQGVVVRAGDAVVLSITLSLRSKP